MEMAFLSVCGGSLDLEKRCMVWGKTMHGLRQNDAWIEAKQRMLFYEKISEDFFSKMG